MTKKNVPQTEKPKKVQFIQEERTLLELTPGRTLFSPRGSVSTEGRSGGKGNNGPGEGLARIVHGLDNQRSYKENGVRYIKKRTPISYEMYFEPERYRFFLSVPESSQRSMSEHIKKAWTGASVNVVEEDYISVFHEEATSYCDLNMGKYYIFPFQIGDAEPLNGLINVARGLHAGEKLMLQLMLIPLKPKWQVRGRELLKEYQEKGTSLRAKGFEQLLKDVEDDVTEMFDIITSSILDLKTEKKTEGPVHRASERELEAIRSKLTESGFNFKLRLFATGKTHSRRSEIIRDASNALRAIEGMNLLEPSPAKAQAPAELRYAGPLQEFSFKQNIMGITELGQFLKMPDRGLLDRTPQIAKASQQQKPIPNKMYKGVVPAAVVDPLDPKIVYFQHDNMEWFMGAKIIAGAPGAGKTTYLQVLVKQLSLLKHGVFIFDIIKSCEFTKEIASVLQPEDYDVWDMETMWNEFSFDYAELYRYYNEDDYMNRKEIANLIGTQISGFLDAMNPDEPLKTRMKKVIHSVAKIVFVHKDQTLNDFFNAIQFYDKRHKYLKMGDIVNSEGIRLLEDEEIENAKFLDRRGDKNEELRETDLTKADPVLNRMYMLTSDPRTNQMLKNGYNGKFDVSNAILNPRVIMLRVPQQSSIKGRLGYSQETGAMITAFITYKLWMIKKMMTTGEDEKELVKNPLGETVKREDLYATHLIYDEIHLIPQTMEMLSGPLKEFRKYRLSAIFTCHGLNSFSPKVQAEIGRIRASYILMSPVDHDTVDRLKDTFSQIDPQEIKDMPSRHVAACIHTGSEYVQFIAQAPGRLQDFEKIQKELAKPKIRRTKQRTSNFTPAEKVFRGLEGIGITLDRAENAPIDYLINGVSRLFTKSKSTEAASIEASGIEISQSVKEALESRNAASKENHDCGIVEKQNLLPNDRVPLLGTSNKLAESVVAKVSITQSAPKTELTVQSDLDPNLLLLSGKKIKSQESLIDLDSSIPSPQEVRLESIDWGSAFLEPPLKRLTSSAKRPISKRS